MGANTTNQPWNCECDCIDISGGRQQIMKDHLQLQAPISSKLPTQVELFDRQVKSQIFKEIDQSQVKLQLDSFVLRNAEDQRNKFQLDQIKSNRSYKTIKRNKEDIYKGLVNKQNRPHGLGELYKKDGSYVIANFVNNTLEGKIFYANKNQQIYRGNMQNNSLHGQVVINSKNYRFDGKYQKGKKCKGKEVTNQYIFDGQFSNDKWKSGVLEWSVDGFRNLYRGTFNSQQQFEGKNCNLSQQSGTYQGDFEEGQKHGKGTYKFNSNLIYEGEYRKGKKQGRGVLKKKNKQGIWKPWYLGQFKNGLPHGKGRIMAEGQPPVDQVWEEGIVKTVGRN